MPASKTDFFWVTCGIYIYSLCFQAAKGLEEKLKVSGVPYEVHIYPGNAHAFMNRSPDGVKRRKSMGLPDEDETAVELAWSRFQSWMTRYLSA
jgi:carboxymethylenebutenolidase